jgi:hypothetical protein
MDVKKKPIDPDTHGVLDYAFFAAIAAAPTVFGLEGPARKVCYGFSALQGTIPPFTDYKYGIRRAIPFEVHGKLDAMMVPTLLAVPWAAGALRKRNARLFFGAYFAAAAVTWMLTDWNAHKRARSGARVSRDARE